jgi:hypothetical protein
MEFLNCTQVWFFKSLVNLLIILHFLFWRIYPILCQNFHFFNSQFSSHFLFQEFADFFHFYVKVFKKILESNFLNPIFGFENLV